LPECSQRHVITALRDHRAAPAQTGAGQPRSDRDGVDGVGAHE
jgi:hypothetical protein